MKKIYKNHLVNSTSPYLLQHVNNPVDWYPWGQEALEKAKRENKPILLSIGYSACHWCHVMAHESFEDENTAKFMNEFFVNIKVDREERPDLDKVYQMAHQLLAQRPGGWPLTVFLTPDKHIPFYVGTYFPLEESFGRPAFRDVLRFIHEIYNTRKVEIDQQNESLLNVFAQITPKPSDEKFNLSPVEQAIKNITANYDWVNGGFGDAPKFPQTNYLELLLRHYINDADESAFKMLTQTLIKMAEGGFYDQIGGGFFRYCVDAAWQIPHFEKMLYDNALLLTIYTEIFVITKNTLFADIATGIGEWVMREMQSPEGGYYATLDADSEGQEGKFYLWDREEIAKILTEKEFRIFSEYYNLNLPANFEGHWHLYQNREISKLAEQLHISEQEIMQQVDIAKNKLLKTRANRVRPERDEKILVSWNALMIKAMLLAGEYLSRSDFIESAKKALNFIHKKLWKSDRLFTAYKNKQANIQAYLDDYVYLLDAIVSYLQVIWDSDYFDFAKKLIAVVLHHFQDQQEGGFFFTADDQETLLYRPKNMIDEAMPADNGVVALVLNRFGYLTGEKSYIHVAEKTLKMVWSNLQHYPDACVTLLMALQEFLSPPEIIIIRGGAEEMNDWRKVIDKNYSPTRLIFRIPKDAKNLPNFLLEKKPQSGTVAYVCKGFECLAPINDLAKLNH